MSLLYDPWNLVETLPTLTKRERRILKLRYLDDLETEEIQKRLKVSYGTVTASAMHGIKELRSHFRKQGRRVARGKLKPGPASGLGWRWKREARRDRIGAYACGTSARPGLRD